MLTKSQAKIFFLAGTIIFSVLFLGLSYDTHVNKHDDQTNADQITPEVVAGKHLWEANNCMGCHTIFGEGAYYAPELTKVIERRGASLCKRCFNVANSLGRTYQWKKNGGLWFF